MNEMNDSMCVSVVRCVNLKKLQIYEVHEERLRLPSKTEHSLEEALLCLLPLPPLTYKKKQSTTVISDLLIHLHEYSLAIYLKGSSDVFLKIYSLF